MYLNHIDARTIVTLAAAAAVLMSVVLAQKWRSDRLLFSGMGWWSIAPSLIFFGATFISARTFIPLEVSVLAGNGLIISGVCAFLAGTQRFYGYPVSRWPWIVLTFSLIFFFIFTQNQPSYTARIIVYALSMSSIVGMQAVLLWRHARSTFAGRFLLSGIGAAVMLLLVRVATLPFDQEVANGAASASTQVNYLASYGILLLWLTIGFILLAEERLRLHIQHMAIHDGLTGALTRRALFDGAYQRLAAAGKQGMPVSMLMLDLDCFKDINDTHGHIAGDAVLREFSEHVRNLLRPVDLFGRYGGEEFLILLPDADKSLAIDLAEKIRTSALAISLPHVTVSIGATSLSSADLNAGSELILEMLLKQADKALYRAKENGRDQVVHYINIAQP